MSGGPSVLRRPALEKSNIELINSLKSNFEASKQAFPPCGSQLKEQTSGRETNNTPYDTWTAREGDTIYVPSIDFSRSGLAEDRSEYDITVKLFFLPNVLPSKRHQHTQEAIGLILKSLHISSIDLLIVSFPGVSFDADDEEDPDPLDLKNKGNADDIDAMIETWSAFESLHTEGIALQIGLSEFGSERLQKFLPRTKIRPSVDQINVRDCCVVPKP